LAKTTVFRQFLALARRMLLPLHGSRMVRSPPQRTKTMTFSNAPQFVLSMIAALVTSAVFVSAAIGPVVQFA
jgi:hypothetical protein